MSDYPGACPQNLAPPSLVVHGDSDDDFDFANRDVSNDFGVNSDNDSIAINRQLNRDAAAQNLATSNSLFPSSTAASSSSLSLPTMSAEDEAGDSPASPGFKNPFNFQTQVYSAGPVKSVRRHASSVCLIIANTSPQEHWTASWSQIQA